MYKVVVAFGVPPGTVIAGYEIERVLGHGGMGDVYLAKKQGESRRVALKLLNVELAADTRFRARFERESHMAASLEHPNIVPVYATGEVDHVRYIAMRYVDGPTLRDLIERESPLDVRRSLALLDQVASALDAAHEIGLVHRDVKPANVLVARGGASEFREHAYLTDFGVSKYASSTSEFTRTGQFVGTSLYAAPEQIRGEVVDGRVDVYAFGGLLYECLTGHPPFERETELALMWAQITDPPPKVTALRPDLSAVLDDVIACAMAKASQERFATCSELVSAARAAIVQGRKVEDTETLVSARPASAIHGVRTAPGSGNETPMPGSAETVVRSADGAENSAAVVPSGPHDARGTGARSVPLRAASGTVERGEHSSEVPDEPGTDTSDAPDIPSAAEPAVEQVALEGVGVETIVRSPVDAADSAQSGTVVAVGEGSDRGIDLETTPAYAAWKARSLGVPEAAAPPAAKATQLARVSPAVAPTNRTVSAPTRPGLDPRSRRAVAGQMRRSGVLGVVAAVLLGGSAALALALRGGDGQRETITTGPRVVLPAAISLPSISGNERVGDSVVATHGVWRNAPTRFVYQWQRCDRKGSSCLAVASATGRTYRLAAPDAGHRVRIRVTASNSGGSSSKVSRATAVVAAAFTPPRFISRPSVSGTAQEGLALTLRAGTWKGTKPIAFNRIWQRCNSSGSACVASAGATGTSYVLTTADIGHTIRVEERASNRAGRGVAASRSTPVVRVKPTPYIPPKPSPRIIDVPKPPQP